MAKKKKAHEGFLSFSFLFLSFFFFELKNTIYLNEFACKTGRDFVQFAKDIGLVEDENDKPISSAFFAQSEDEQLQQEIPHVKMLYRLSSPMLSDFLRLADHASSERIWLWGCGNQ